MSWPARLTVSVPTLSTAAGIVLAIDEGQRLLVAVTHNEARGGLLDGTRWWEAAGPKHDRAGALSISL
jgi:hypothetical protein